MKPNISDNMKDALKASRRQLKKIEDRRIKKYNSLKIKKELDKILDDFKLSL